VQKAVESLPAEAFLDNEFMIPAMQESRVAQNSIFAVAPPSVRADCQVMAAAIGYSGLALESAAPSLKAHKELVLAAVEVDGWAMEFASVEMRGDRDVALAAIANDADAFRFVTPALKSDFEVCCRAVQMDGWILRTMPRERARDREIVLIAMTTTPEAISAVELPLRADKEVVLRSVQSFGDGLQYADPGLQDDFEVAFAAVSHTALAFRWASDRLRGNKDLALKAMKRDGLALPFVDPSLQDLEVFVAAVKQTFTAFMYVPTSFKSQVIQELGWNSNNDWSTEFDRWEARRREFREQAEKQQTMLLGDIKVHFKTLGLHEDERDGKIVTRQYRRLALLHHPDKNPDDPEGARNRMTAINQAYEAIRKILRF